MNKWLAPFRWEHRKFWYVLCTAYFVATYGISNHFPIHPPIYLPFTDLDKAIPFWPASAWIYASVYAMPLIVPFFVHDKRMLNVTLWSFFFISTIEALIFFSFPTVYPRELYPLTSGFSDFPLNFIRLLDQPTNCFPSQHVSLAFLTAFIIERVDPKKGMAGVLWACAISFSTLLTKQHYVWDLVFGYAITRIVFLTILRTIPQEAEQ